VLPIRHAEFEAAFSFGGDGAWCPDTLACDWRLCRNLEQLAALNWTVS